METSFTLPCTVFTHSCNFHGVSFDIAARSSGADRFVGLNV